MHKMKNIYIYIYISRQQFVIKFIEDGDIDGK